METAARTSRPRVSRFAPLLVNAICIFTLHQSGSFCVAQVLQEQKAQKLKLPMVTVTCINQSTLCSPCVREMWGHTACYKMPVKWKTHKQPHRQYWVIQRLCCSSVIQQLISCGRLALKILFPSCACITRITINLNCLYILLWRYFVDQGGPHAQRESEFLTAELQNTQLASRQACAQNSHLQVTEKFTIIHCNIFRNHMEKKKERYLNFSVQTFQRGRKPTPKKPPKNKLEKKKSLKKLKKPVQPLVSHSALCMRSKQLQAQPPPPQTLGWPQISFLLTFTLFDFHELWLIHKNVFLFDVKYNLPSSQDLLAPIYFMVITDPLFVHYTQNWFSRKSAQGSVGKPRDRCQPPPVEDAAGSTVSAAAARSGSATPTTGCAVPCPLPAAPRQKLTLWQESERTQSQVTGTQLSTAWRGRGDGCVFKCWNAPAAPRGTRHHHVSTVQESTVPESAQPAAARAPSIAPHRAGSFTRSFTASSSTAAPVPGARRGLPGPCGRRSSPRTTPDLQGFQPACWTRTAKSENSC